MEILEHRKDEVTPSPPPKVEDQPKVEDFFDKRTLKKFPGIQLKTSQVDDTALGQFNFMFEGRGRLLCNFDHLIDQARYWVRVPSCKVQLVSNKGRHN